jgi:hypothetical protein
MGYSSDVNEFRLDGVQNGVGKTGVKQRRTSSSKKQYRSGSFWIF